MTSFDQVALDPGRTLFAPSIVVPLADLPAEETVTGKPRAGAVRIELGEGLTAGIWAMSEGTARDTEIDECFVVIGGRASVAVYGAEDHAGTRAIVDTFELEAGSIARLSAGMRTEWVVHEELRKVYFLPTASST